MKEAYSRQLRNFSFRHYAFSVKLTTIFRLNFVFYTSEFPLSVGRKGTTEANVRDIKFVLTKWAVSRKRHNSGDICAKDMNERSKQKLNTKTFITIISFLLLLQS